MDIILAFIFFLMGISIGSFLNVVADRIPMGKSILSPPSHCFGCGRELESRDLIPVVSYILLKGRCRYCKVRIPIRSMVVELVTGLLFVVAWLKFGPNWPMLEALAYISMLIVLAITDLEKGVLPARIVYPEIGVALFLAIANSLFKYQPDILSSLIGLALGAAFMLTIWGIPRLIGKHFLNFGHVGMLALTGASTGYPLITAAVFLAFSMWVVFKLIQLILTARRISMAVPLAVFIAAGGIWAIFWGKQLLSTAPFLAAG